MSIFAAMRSGVAGSFSAISNLFGCFDGCLGRRESPFLDDEERAPLWTAAGSAPAQSRASGNRRSSLEETEHHR